MSLCITVYTDNLHFKLNAFPDKLLQPDPPQPPMTLKFCPRAARFMAVWLVWGLLALLAALPAHAGNIGFSISFTGDEVSITNTGSEPAYLVSEWTLDAAAKWQRIQVVAGNAAYLAPGQSLTGRRLTAAAPTGLGRADPLLVLLHDQAGSRIAQLAWRHTPATTPQPLPVQRHGGQLSVAADAARAQKIIASYGLTVPYEGIHRLGQPLSATDAPPNPLRHGWTSATPLVLATGAAQGGAWLVHENAAGELSVQIVPDGVVRGQEQVPIWLSWVRQYALQVATWLAGLGALMLAGGWAWAARRSGAMDCGSSPQ